MNAIGFFFKFSAYFNEEWFGVAFWQNPSGCTILTDEHEHFLTIKWKLISHWIHRNFINCAVISMGWISRHLHFVCLYFVGRIRKRLPQWCITLLNYSVKNRYHTIYFGHGVHIVSSILLKYSSSHVVVSLIKYKENLMLHFVN